MSLYNQRGVSAQKEEVHKATSTLDKGLYPHAFCRIYPDYLNGDDEWVNIMHADGAGTKSVLAYLYWKETGDLSVWKGIAQDAIVMNLDDLLCVGVHDQILFSSTIDRNKSVIPGDVLEVLIGSTQEFFDNLRTFGVNISYLGGETADVGDVVRTIAVNGTMTVRWPKDRLVTNGKIAVGNVIVGLASHGQASYEQKPNSGIGSNGLTSARHDVLSKYYSLNFPETFEPMLDEEVVYIGRHRLTDPLNEGQVGDLLLSPTRTYAPVLREILLNHFEDIAGIIHCSGGGQTKCLKYLPGNMKIVKDNLFDPPEIFRIIKESSGADDREMYQVFNMGHRMEIFTSEEAAERIISVANRFNIDARVIGRVEASPKKELVLRVAGEEILF
jgi:phosphoribosylformylglycinamidine cyclo-ligase